MAFYHDVPAEPEWDEDDVRDLLVGAASVEVVPDGKKLILRVWYGQHCSLSQHTPVE